MARGRKKKNRIRAKRFENEILLTCEQIYASVDLKQDPESESFQGVKNAVGKMIKRLLDHKLLREQEFYVGDWVFSGGDRSMAAVEIIDVNYKLKTARIKDKKEGEIWVRFNDLVKDDDFYYL
ncbi:hypothetical protein HOF92_16490 [bacterium]|nr:hypothetical protein [bacterium]